jgi:hypothetical protein
MFVELVMFSKFENFHKKKQHFLIYGLLQNKEREKDIISFVVASFFYFYLQFILTNNISNTLV